MVPARVATLTRIVAVAAGGDHSLALSSKGIVSGWGQDVHGELGDGGIDRYQAVPVQVVGLTRAKAIAAGQVYSFAIWRSETS